MTKEELNNYTELCREIKNIEEKILYYEEQKTSIKSQIITDMPTSSTGERDRLGKLLVQIEELLDLYYEKRTKLVNTQIKIEEAIEKLEDATDRNIMRLRYLDNYTWEKICVALNYSWNGIHKKHRKILDIIR